MAKEQARRMASREQRKGQGLKSSCTKGQVWKARSAGLRLYISLIVLAVGCAKGGEQGWRFQGGFDDHHCRKQPTSPGQIQAHHGGGCQREDQCRSAPPQQQEEIEFQIGTPQEGKCQEGRAMVVLSQPAQRTSTEGAGTLYTGEEGDQRSHCPNPIGVGQNDEWDSWRRRNTQCPRRNGCPRGAHGGGRHEDYGHETGRVHTDAGDHQEDAGGPPETYAPDGRTTATDVLHGAGYHRTQCWVAIQASRTFIHDDTTQDARYYQTNRLGTFLEKERRSQLRSLTIPEENSIPIVPRDLQVGSPRRGLRPGESRALCGVGWIWDHLGSTPCGGDYDYILENDEKYLGLNFLQRDVSEGLLVQHYMLAYDMVIHYAWTQLSRCEEFHRMLQHPTSFTFDEVQKFHGCPHIAPWTTRQRNSRVTSLTADELHLGYCDLTADGQTYQRTRPGPCESNLPDWLTLHSGFQDTWDGKWKEWQHLRGRCCDADFGFEDDSSLSLLQYTIAVTVLTMVDGRPETAGPMTYDDRWAWAYRQCGLTPPEQFSRIYIHRSVHPVQHESPTVLFHITIGADPMMTIRGVEARWSDLIPSDGHQVFWQIIRSHPTLQTSEVLDVTVPHFVLYSQLEEQRTNIQAAIFVEVHRILPMGMTGTVHVRIVYPRHNAYSLMQAVGCLTECTSMMQCKIYHNDRELMQNYIWAWDGDFVVLRMKPIPINDPSDSEIESPHPMRAALRSPSTTSDSETVAIAGGQTPPPPGHQATTANRPLLYHVHRPDFGEGRTMSGRILGDVDVIPQDQQLTAIWDDTANGEFDLYDIDETYYRDFDHIPPMRVLVIVVWQDFNRAPHLRGVLMHLRVNARREIKAVPLARETSELGILAWLRLLDLCTRQRTMTCKVFRNNIRARGSEPIQLWHADYLRVEATTTGRSVPTPVLTATSEHQDSREHRDGEAFWPRPPTVRSRTEAQSLVLGRTVQPRCHAGFWVFAAWWANILLFIALSWLPNPPTKGRKPRRRHGTGWKRARTAAWLILLISAEQILPVASIHLMPPTAPIREHSTVFEHKTHGHTFIDPCRGLPPPGNPGCTGMQCRYDDQVAEGIWGALRSMYRPVATPMRAGRRVVVNLANHLTFDEDEKDRDSPHPEESRHFQTQGLDAPRRDNTFSMYVGDDFMDDRHGLTVPWLETPAPHPSTFVDDLHPSALQLLFTNLALEDDDMRYIHSFTDGSAGKGDDGYFSAWAFCIFESSSTDDDMTNAKYIQWYGNGCTIDAMDPQWIGATEHNSKVAEAEALTWALLWTLQLEDNRKVCIHADATSVLFPATGQWNFHLAETLMRRLRATHQLAHSMRTGDHLQCTHVKAHSGHPGNEMADSIAVTIRRRPDRARPPPISVAKWYQGEPPTIEWLWATFDPHVRPHQVPDYEDGYLRWTDVDKEKYIPWLQIESADNSQGPTEMHLTFTMASFNVSTLKQPARAAYLRRQFTDRRIVFAGLQETRAGENDIPDSDYIRIIATSDQGVSGCELWCSNTVPIGYIGDKPIHLHRSMIQVLHCTAQLLMTHIALPSMPLLIIVAHAPHSGQSGQAATITLVETAP